MGRWIAAVASIGVSVVPLAFAAGGGSIATGPDVPLGKHRVVLLVYNVEYDYYWKVRSTSPVARLAISGARRTRAVVDLLKERKTGDLLVLDLTVKNLTYNDVLSVGCVGIFGTKPKAHYTGLGEPSGLREFSRDLLTVSVTRWPRDLSYLVIRGGESISYSIAVDLNPGSIRRARDVATTADMWISLRYCGGPSPPKLVTPLATFVGYRKLN